MILRRKKRRGNRKARTRVIELFYDYLGNTSASIRSNASTPSKSKSIISNLTEFFSQKYRNKLL